MPAPRLQPALGFAVAVLGLLGLSSHASAGPPDPLYQRLVYEHDGDQPVRDVAGMEAEVATRTVDYGTVDDERVSGYLARPRTEQDDEGPMPALLVIHERWGLNDNIRAMTRRLAAEGYTALAVDFYGGETAESPGRAQLLMEEATANEDQLERNLRQAFLYLDVMPSTDRVGSIGWRFGGAWSLRTALMVPDELDAAVMYYGELITEEAQLEPLSAPLLGHFGGTDTAIPPARVREFDRLLDDLDKPHEIHVYDHAGHAFANPSGTRYAEEPAELAWQRTVEFLDATLTTQ